MRDSFVKKVMKPKTIGIIGAGLVGKALATQLIKIGHTVKVANSRGPHTLQTFERETGATAVDVKAITSNVDIIILAVPLKNVVSLRTLLSNLAPAAVVLDACNYYPWRDEKILEIDAGMTESVWVAQQLGLPVIKAFNNIIASNMIISSKAKGTPDRVSLPVSGNDTTAKAAIMALVEEIGFTAFDAGTLEDSWRQQPAQPVYCTDPSLKELPVLLARADKKKAAANRGRIEKILKRIPAGFSGQDLTQASRLFIGLDIFKLKSWNALLRLAWAMF